MAEDHFVAGRGPHFVHQVVMLCLAVSIIRRRYRAQTSGIFVLLVLTTTVVVDLLKSGVTGDKPILISRFCLVKPILRF